MVTLHTFCGDHRLGEVDLRGASKSKTSYFTAAILAAITLTSSMFNQTAQAETSAAAAGNTSVMLPRVTGIIKGNFTPVVAPPSNLGSFDIVINPNASLSGNAAALAAFNRAANQWEAFISDPITVTVDAGLAVLGPGILGSTSSVQLQASYTNIRNQMVADADADDGVLASLPTAAQFTGTVVSGSSFNGNIVASKANLKALNFAGLDGTFGASDGTITFSTDFTFDYDNSDGVSAGTTDFETVASHEIGHLLGFVSEVDIADAGVLSLAPNPLDMFRFRNIAGSKPTTLAEFTSFPRNFVPGQDVVFSDLVGEFRFSTGVALGDGRQASHWKDDSLTGINLGIMDPTLANGVVTNISNADRRAMDLIGYDIVPEPSMLATLSLGALLLGRRRK